ncbi:MAG: hypothetical protein Kow0075_16890 [Salibacteraceae bacterium]
MKKSFIFSLLMVLGIVATAQISLEHTYNNRGLQLVQLDSDEYVYVHHTVSGIVVYNTNHSSTNTINVNVPNYYDVIGTGFYSNALFDTDSSTYEFVLYLQHDSGTSYLAQVYNDAGALLFTLENSMTLQLVKIGDEYKLIGSNYIDNKSFVFSLPGGVYEPNIQDHGDGVGIIENNAFSRMGSPYPNPSNSVVNIPLNGSKYLKVYNIDGALIFEADVDGKETATIFVHHWAPGVYLISTDQGTERLVVR